MFTGPLASAGLALEISLNARAVVSPSSMVSKEPLAWPGLARRAMAKWEHALKTAGPCRDGPVSLFVRRLSESQQTRGNTKAVGSTREQVDAV